MMRLRPLLLAGAALISRNDCSTYASKWPEPPDDAVDAYVRTWAAGGTARRCGDVGAHGDCSWMSGFGPIDVACTIHIDRVGLLDDKRGPALRGLDHSIRHARRRHRAPPAVDWLRRGNQAAEQRVHEARLSDGLDDAFVALTADRVVFGLGPTLFQEVARLGLVATVVVVHICDPYHLGSSRAPRLDTELTSLSH